jgi:hypothetical protein
LQSAIHGGLRDPAGNAGLKTAGHNQVGCIADARLSQRVPSRPIRRRRRLLEKRAGAEGLGKGPEEGRLRFYLRSSQDFVYFSKTVERDPSTFAWTRGSLQTEENELR